MNSWKRMGAYKHQTVGTHTDDDISTVLGQFHAVLLNNIGKLIYMLKTITNKLCKIPPNL